MSSIDNFKAKLVGGGARPNLFSVICNFPSFAQGDAELASFMIKGAALPGSVLGQIQVPWRGRFLPVPGDRTFEPVSLTVINDTNMAVRNAFERWMNFINSNVSNVAGSSIPSEYMSDLEIRQLDKSGDVLKTYFMRSAWPTNVSQIDLSNDSTDQIEEFTVEMVYTYWEAPGITS